MWEIAEGYPDTAAEILADFDFDRGKLLRTVETMRGRRGPLWDIIPTCVGIDHQPDQPGASERNHPHMRGDRPLGF